MKITVVSFFVLITSVAYSQVNKDLCEKLFNAYQTAANEFSYAKGDFKANYAITNEKYQNCEYDLKKSFLENTSFTNGSISIYYSEDPSSKKIIKKTVLNIKTDHIGEFSGSALDIPYFTQFLRFEENLKNCFSGGNATIANLSSLENYTHFFKYVLYSKNVFTPDYLIDESLTIDNPYIEVSLHKTMGKVSMYVGIKIIHRTYM